MDKEIKIHIINLIKTSGIASFSTLNLDGTPEARVLCNMANYKLPEDNKNIELFFGCSKNSPKVKQISKNNISSVYYYNDSMDCLNLFGKSEIVNDKKIKDAVWQEGWAEYYPNGGKDDPEYCIIKFTPSAYKYYTVKDGDYSKLEGKL